jgi:hypothetical protein
MSSNTKLYLNQYNQKNDEFISTNRLMTTVKDSINELVKESYNKYNIQELEANPNIPFIRNVGFVNEFDYKPNYDPELNIDYELFYANFCLFRDPDNWANEKNNAPKSEFKITKKNIEVPHAARNLQILTRNNFDASNSLEKDFHIKDSFTSFLMGDNQEGQEFMEKLGKKLHEKLGTEVYYIRTDINDEPAVLIKKENKNKQKIKP